MSDIFAPTSLEVKRLKNAIIERISQLGGLMGEIKITAGKSGKVFIFDVENNIEVADEICCIIEKSPLIDIVSGEDFPAIYDWNTGTTHKPSSVVYVKFK